MGVAIETGHFKQAVRSYHRLLDLKGKHTDLMVLQALVKATKEGEKLESDLRTLFGRITSLITSDAEIWRLYADLEQPGQ